MIKKILLMFVSGLMGVSASANCTLPAEEHPENNIGYEVGESCTQVTIVGSASTNLKFIGSQNNECKVVSYQQTNGKSVLVLSMDASKEVDLGAGCKVKTTFANGKSRILNFSAYMD
ncbi:MAG: hypothetical protein H6623_05490 [Bdellovibrionaceae bacterium]|nr:hypothetical protein [Pseudobdellovibrionaceae bacterium]